MSEKIYIVWEDRNLSPAEIRGLGLWRRDGRRHKCVVDVLVSSSEPTREELAGLTGLDRVTDGKRRCAEMTGEAWEVEEHTFYDARRGDFGDRPGQSRGERLVVQQSIRQGLMDHAGWCRWCNARAFVRLALAIDASEVLL